MCWTTTKPGASSGSAISSTRSASVPPVDVPMATTLSVVTDSVRVGTVGSTTSAEWRFSDDGMAARRRGRASAAPRTLSTIMMACSYRKSWMPTAGFWMTSTAPYSSARSTVSAPFFASAEQTRTGIGWSAMICCRNVRPSTCGISMSSTMTSGRRCFILPIAISGCAAVSTWMPISRDSTVVMTCRMTAESSTTNTFSVPAAGISLTVGSPAIDG